MLPKMLMSLSLATLGLIVWNVWNHKLLIDTPLSSQKIPRNVTIDATAFYAQERYSPGIKDECADLVDIDPDGEACRWTCLEGKDPTNCARSCCYHARCSSAAQSLVEKGTVIHRGFSTEVWIGPWRGIDVVFKRPISASSVALPDHTELEAQAKYNDLFVEKKEIELQLLEKFEGEPWLIRSYGNCLWASWSPWDNASFPFFMVEPMVGLKDSFGDEAEEQPLQQLPWCTRIKVALQIQRIIEEYHEREVAQYDWHGGQIGLSLGHGSVRVVDVDSVSSIMSSKANAVVWYPSFQPATLFRDWQCHLGVVPLGRRKCASLGNSLEQWRLSWGTPESNPRGPWGVTWKRPERLENFLQAAGFGWVFEQLPFCLSENEPYIDTFLSDTFQKQTVSGRQRCENAPYQRSRSVGWNFRPC